MTREPLLIVDGYNLMHRLVPKRLLGGPGGLERARTNVVQRVATLLKKEELPLAAVVFDAAGTVDPGAANAADPQATQVIRVLFAAGFPDADSMIEEMIRKHSSPRRLTVVSSDRRLMDAARRRGAWGIDCDEWLDRRETEASRNCDVAGEPEEKAHEGGLPGADESRYWLREFGFDEPDQPDGR